jgi:hypothetical protein
MIDILTFIRYLPPDLVRYTSEFVPNRIFLFTNKLNYNLYRPLIISLISNQDNCLRDMIRQDNEFVVDVMIRENYLRWAEIKRYRYKNMVFKNYLYFIIYFCVENESTNCRNVVNSFLKEHGLNKNLHKKNIVNYIRWKS